MKGNEVCNLQILLRLTKHHAVKMGMEV